MTAMSALAPRSSTSQIVVQDRSPIRMRRVEDYNNVMYKLVQGSKPQVQSSKHISKNSIPSNITIQPKKPNQGLGYKQV